MTWQPVSTIPLRKKIRIKTATGMERIATCYFQPRDGAPSAACISVDRAFRGDLRAVAWDDYEGN